MPRNLKMPRNRAEQRRCPFTEDPEPRRGHCAVCGKPVQTFDTRGPHLCENHDEEDLRERREVEAQMACEAERDEHLVEQARRR